MAKGHAKTDSGHISTLKKNKAKQCWMCLKPTDRCTWVYLHASTRDAAADFFTLCGLLGLSASYFSSRYFSSSK